MKTKELIKLAYSICEANNLTCAITGSLMLVIRGIEPLRTPGDIDFITEKLDAEYIDVPEGYLLHDETGEGSGLESIVYKHKDTGFKIEFMYSDEEFEDIEYGRDFIPCGQLECLIDAKIGYYKNDKSEVSKAKHKADLLHLDKYINK